MTIHNRPVILAIVICEKYFEQLAFLSEITYLTIPVQFFKGCFKDACLFLVTSRGAEEPN